MFGRRATDSAADDSAGLDGLEVDEELEPEEARTAFTAPKDRPTPKRSEAEKRRREPYAAPGDRRAASEAGRTRDAASRQKKLEAMRRGEDWALPRKDQGQVRGLARDVVDARRGISEYYLYAIVVLVALLFVPTLRGSAIVDYLILFILLVIAGEGWWVGRKVTALAAERFPGESTRGVKMYAALRGTQIRKMRVPAPRVERGDQV